MGCFQSCFAEENFENDSTSDSDSTWYLESLPTVQTMEIDDTMIIAKTQEAKNMLRLYGFGNIPSNHKISVQIIATECK